MVIANPTYYKRTRLDNTRTVFHFPSMTEYNRFIEEVDANAPRGSNARTGLDRLADPSYVRTRLSMDWFGTNNASLVTGALDTYLFNNELDRYLQNVRASTINVDKVDIDQVKQIKFTEQEIGIFSFDLASLGLIPVYEYYSPLLDRIVNSNFVRARKDQNNKPIRDADGKIIFYHVFRPEVKQHVVDFNSGMNGYYSEILGRVIEKEQLTQDPRTGKFIYPHQAEVPEHQVRQDHKLGANGKKKFTTTWKKSFIHIPKVEKSLPRVDIIVTSSFAGGVDAETQMIYSSMSAIALAERLSAAGINYRIIVCYTTRSSGSPPTREIYSYVVAKRDGEVLDRNSMAILLSDGRMLRYRGFRGDLTTQYDAGYDNNISALGIGGAINDSVFVDRQYSQAEADAINARGNQTVRAEGNGDKYIFRNLRDLSQDGNRVFDKLEDAYNFIRANQEEIDRVKIAYMDYLSRSTHPEDIAASRNWSSKVLFSGALNQQEAENQYNNAIRSITNIV